MEKIESRRIEHLGWVASVTKYKEEGDNDISTSIGFEIAYGKFVDVDDVHLDVDLTDNDVKHLIYILRKSIAGALGRGRALEKERVSNLLGL